jgi:hypothetical protein
MNRISLFLILTAILSGCSTIGIYTKKQAVKRFCSGDTIRIVKIDTVIKSTRDTFYRAGDTVKIETKVNVDCVDGKPKFKGQSSTKKIGKTTATLNIDTAGKLVINCNTDSLLHIIDSLMVQVSTEKNNSVHVREVASFFETLHAVRWWLLISFISGVALGLYLQFRR